jgi:hypothetical protein
MCNLHSESIWGLSESVSMLHVQWQQNRPILLTGSTFSRWCWDIYQCFMSTSITFQMSAGITSIKRKSAVKLICNLNMLRCLYWIASILRISSDLPFTHSLSYSLCIKFTLKYAFILYLHWLIVLLFWIELFDLPRCSCSNNLIIDLFVYYVEMVEVKQVSLNDIF